MKNVWLLGTVLWAAAPALDVYAQTRPPSLAAPPAPAVAPEAATVGLVLTVAADGTVSDVQVAASAGAELDEQAVAAARAFVFVPAQKDGAAVAARVRYDYAFVAAAGRLEGRVLAGDQPAAGVEVTIESEGTDTRRVFTDAAGHWSTGDLPTGRYHVRAGAVAADEEVTGGQVTEVTYRLPRQTAPGYGAVARVAAPEREVTRRSVTREELSTTAGTRGDALRVLELLPGVSRPPSGQGLLILRGSNPEDSQLFVDGAQVLRIYHFGGLTSFAPSALLERLDLFPSNFSTRYGRALGGVVEVRLRDPRTDGPHVTADLNLIDAGAFAETPLGGGWSMAAGVRRSTIDLWIKAAAGDDAASITAAPVYLDYQALFSYRASARNKLRLQIYGSVDDFGLLIDPVDSDPTIAGDLDQHSDFHRAQLVWEHRPGERVEHDLSFTAGTFAFGVSLGAALHQDIRAYDVLLRDEWRWKLGGKLRLTAGADVMLQAGNIQYAGPRANQTEGNPDDGEELGDRPMTAIDVTTAFFRPAAYLEASYRPIDKLELVGGARVDVYSEIEGVTFDPRLVARYQLAPRTLLKGGVGRFSQPPDYGEALEGLGNPDLGAEHAIHVSAGVEQALGKRATVGVEVYGKWLEDLIVDGMDGELTNAGEGRIYGAELAARLFPGGKFSGFFSYSLSRSERRDRSDEQGGDWRLFDHDQTHVLTASLSWKPGRGYSFGATARLVSGALETPVMGSVYDASRDHYVPIYGAINSERRTPFKQLDLRLEKAWKIGPTRLAAYLDLQNATNVSNAEGSDYSYDFRTRRFYSGLPLIPAFGLRGEL